MVCSQLAGAKHSPQSWTRKPPSHCLSLAPSKSVLKSVSSHFGQRELKPATSVRPVALKLAHCFVLIRCAIKNYLPYNCSARQRESEHNVHLPAFPLRAQIPCPPHLAWFPTLPPLLLSPGKALPLSSTCSTGTDKGQTWEAKPRQVTVTNVRQV